MSHYSPLAYAMVSLSHCVAIVLCVVIVPHTTFAYPRKFDVKKRFGEADIVNKVTFKTTATNNVVDKYESVVLQCEVVGSPNPTIHWLKNGKRIVQGGSQNFQNDVPQYELNDVTSGSKLQLAATRSNLYLDCVTEADEGTYTCVTETPTMRKTQSHTIAIGSSFDELPVDSRKCGGKHSRSNPARIYMWSKSRFEYNNVVTQFYCRAQGNPAPAITWLDAYGKLITSGDGYKITNSGDLVITNPNWEDHMGSYTCVADNGIGTDSTTTFFYPTGRD